MKFWTQLAQIKDNRQQATRLDTDDVFNALNWDAIQTPRLGDETLIAFTTEQLHNLQLSVYALTRALVNEENEARKCDKPMAKPIYSYEYKPVKGPETENARETAHETLRQRLKETSEILSQHPQKLEDVITAFDAVITAAINQQLDRQQSAKQGLAI